MIKNFVSILLASIFKKGFDFKGRSTKNVNQSGQGKTHMGWEWKVKAKYKWDDSLFMAYDMS